MQLHYQGVYFNSQESFLASPSWALRTALGFSSLYIIIVGEMTGS